jgi:hypothetical protein
MAQKKVSAPQKTAQPKKIVATPDMVVVHPEYGEITVGQLLEKIAEKKAITPGVVKKQSIAKAVLQKLWSIGIISASQFIQATNEVKQQQNTKFAPSIQYYVQNGWLLPVKKPGVRPFYMITVQGTKFAEIDVTKPVEKPATPVEVGKAAEEVAEFIKEEEEKK